MSNSNAIDQIFRSSADGMAAGGASASGGAKNKNKPRSVVNNYNFAAEFEFFEGTSFLAALGIGLIPLSALSEIAVAESGAMRFYPGDDLEAPDFYVDGAVALADEYPIVITAANGEDGMDSAEITGVLVFGADGAAYAFNLNGGGIAVIGGVLAEDYQSLVIGGLMTAEQLEHWLAHWGDFSIPVLAHESSTESGDNAPGTVSRSYLVGSDADDELVGDDNPNVLDGGGGNDRLTGGGGGDTFVYRFDSRGERSPENWRGVDGRDEIVDFSLAEGDKLVFIDVSETGERIDTAEEFRQVFDPDSATGGESLVVIDTSDPGANVLEIAFGGGDGGVRISMTEPVGADLIAGDDDYFDGIGEFIEVLNGEDDLLFG